MTIIMRNIRVCGQTRFDAGLFVRRSVFGTSPALSDQDLTPPTKLSNLLSSSLLFFFFFQAEDGIRDGTVTGVQTCALPIFTLNARKSWNTETSTIRHPTAVISPRAGTCLTIQPPNGAASTPPRTSGMK